MMGSVGPLALEGGGDKPGSLEIIEIVEIYLDSCLARLQVDLKLDVALFVGRRELGSLC